MDSPLVSRTVMQVIDEVKPLISHYEPPVYRRGSIKKLTVKNFLTFGEIPPDPKELESAVQPISFEFEPSINIVSGPNGFGKSSLVNAIALCCGSRAVFLRRGKTYEDLIHRGETIDQAEIELFLWNGPDESFGVTCFKRVIHKQNNKNAFYVNGKKLNTFAEYRIKLKEDFRIQPENLTIFLLQDRIADLADLEPPKLLRCAEESLSKEVLEMHNELISRREKYRTEQQELRVMREEDEPQIIRQNEAEKDARKLRERHATFERMGAVRLKLLVQSVQAIESEKSALEEDLRVKETIFRGWATTLSAALVAIKKQTKTLKEKPPEFPPTGKVRDCLAQLDELARIDGDSRNEVVKLQRQMETLEELTGVSPEDQRERVRLDIVHEERAFTQKESMELLTQKKHNNDEQIEKLKGDLETKTNEWDVGKQQFTDHEEQRNVFVQKLMKIPGTKQQFQSRLDALKRNGLVKEDVVKVWEAINDEKDSFDGHVYGPLFLYIQPKNTYKDAVKVMETLLGIKTLQMFVVDSEELCMQMIKRFVREEGYKINVAFIRNQTEMAKFDEETLANFRKRGFADVLDQMYEAPEVVRCHLQQAFSSQTVLVSRRHRADSVADLIEDWKAKSSAKDTLCFSTSENLYNLLKLDDHTITIHQQPVKEAQLLRYEAATNVKLQEERRKKLEEELAVADQNLSQFKGYLKELGREVESLEEELAVREDQSQQIYHDIDEQEESIGRIAELHETLNNLSQVDVKPSSLRLKDLEESIRKENRKRLNLLCSDSEDAVGKVQETSQTLQDMFGEIIKKTGLLLHTSRSHARVLGYGKKRKETESIVRKLKAEKEELEAAFAERKQRARMLTKELFCDRGRTAEEVTNLYQQLKTLKTSAALSKELRSIHATIMPPGTDKISLTEKECTQRMELAKALEDSRYKRLTLEFELRKLQLSQTALRAQWLSKLQQDVDDINKSFGAMLNRMDYDGSVELVKPAEPVEYDQYGLKLKVRFRQDEEEAELGPNTQSGGQMVVAIALFLLALQRRSDAPFRIVDEINQGMDASHERKVFQLMIDAAQSYAQSGGQIISCSPKISPNFTAQNYSVLNFIFLMKTDLKQDAKFFTMESLRPKFIEQTMLQEENDD